MVNAAGKCRADLQKAKPDCTSGAGSESWFTSKYPRFPIRYVYDRAGATNIFYGRIDIDRFDDAEVN
jgi:hypothetical protein